MRSKAPVSWSWPWLWRGRRCLSGCPRKCIDGGYINNGLIVTVKELNRSKTRSFFHIIGFYCYPYNFLVVLGWIHIIHLHDIALHWKCLWQSKVVRQQQVHSVKLTVLLAHNVVVLISVSRIRWGQTWSKYIACTDCTVVREPANANVGSWRSIGDKS